MEFNKACDLLLPKENLDMGVQIIKNKMDIVL